MNDVIRRQSVLDAITASINQYGGRYTAEQLNMWGLFTQMVKELPSAQPYTINPDGRLWITVDDIDKVTAVVIDEHKSKFCKQFYEDYEDAQPEITYCKDCKHFVREDIEEYTPYGYNTHFNAFCDKHWDEEQGEYIDVNFDDYCSFAERREVTT